MSSGEKGRPRNVSYYYYYIPRMPGGSPGVSKVSPFSKPVLGQSLALPDVPAYRASIYLVSACPAHSTSFLQISSILIDGMCIE